MIIKQFWRTIVLTIMFSVLVVSPLLAEEPVEEAENSESWSCCWDDPYGGGRGRYLKNYNFQTTEILDGEVVSLASVPSRSGFLGTHLIVQTDQETIEIHLAPSWFLAEQDFELTPKDKITVIGSRVKVDGQEAIVAREIQKGDHSLVLRDREGFPAWRRGRVPTIDN